jgi:5-oxoprolinase (ATP-hydrolysing)
VARSRAGGARRPAGRRRDSGPAIIAEKNAYHRGGAGLGSQAHDLDHIVLDPAGGPIREVRGRHHGGPVLLEVFNNLFMNIAEQMGLQLQNTAYSSTSRSGWTSLCACSSGRANLIANCAAHAGASWDDGRERIKTGRSEENAWGRMAPATCTI